MNDKQELKAGYYWYYSECESIKDKPILVKVSISVVEPDKCGFGIVTEGKFIPVEPPTEKEGK